MKEIINNENGAIVVMVIAMIVVLVSIVSTYSLLDMVQNDQLQTQYQNDVIQEELLLRSEAIRTHLSLEYDKNKPLPDRKLEILSKDRTTTYTIENKKEYTMLSNFMGYATAEAVAVRSLISARRARIFTKKNFSPIKRYSERLLRNESLAQFQYFTDIEKSENEDGGEEAAIVRFYGADELFGPVHSNDNIWIRNLYGWPTFHALVTTSKRIMDFDTHQPAEQSAPMDDIFLGGYAEEVASIIFDPNANDLRTNGQRPFDPAKDIVYVKIDNNSFSSMYGEIELTGIEQFNVYSWFPDDAAAANAVVNAGGNWYEESDHIWTNHIPIYDTLWTQGPTGTVNNGCVWVESELWIEGEVAGKQTWGSADTIFVVGDITYNGTNVGSPPDDEENPNRDDYFGLVSEEKILIRYKHKDPFNDMILIDNNCEDIWLYGAYAAIGKGDQELQGIYYCHYDGIFTFQYHHTHGSTPDFMAQDPYAPGGNVLYSYIDFHKFVFPPSSFVPPEITGFNLHGGAPQPPYNMCGYPYESPAYVYPNTGPNYNYPYGTDWPWYNPVWPESAADIDTERGIIHIYGAIGQRRRGYVHRSGIDPYNHPNQTEWDLEYYHYDGTHPSSGYNKDYHYDNRFLFVQPPCYPQVYRGFGENVLTEFKAENWHMKIPPE
ncbi:MAG TPA: hypothetical protein ENL20_07010 [Candidatus Cloacimonetes bacterium]|nr:hypothetical protein [Candidatus Cloacimonadota bacterium]